MSDETGERSPLEWKMAQLFALVSEQLAGATFSLLGDEVAAAQAIVDAGQKIDDLADEITDLVWAKLESGAMADSDLRLFVTLLLILPELERSADLAEHIARRAMNHLGPNMSPASRGFVQRMSEVASEMWASVAVAYEKRMSHAVHLDEADEEIDILHRRLTQDVESGVMPVAVATEVTLVGRFYERLGDHAVNLARLIDTLAVPADRSTKT